MGSSSSSAHPCANTAQPSDESPRAPSPPAPGTKRICIIGGGAGGLAMLKIIAEMPQLRSGLWTATLLEARDDVGGIWLPAPPTDDADPPLTPLYDSLTTNLPHPVMAFESLPFPPATPLFPGAAAVRAYLAAFATHFGLWPHIRLRTSVTAVERGSPDGRAWSVHLSSGAPLVADLVVVANGHFRVPRWPETPGLAAWRTAGTATHAVWYRRPPPLGPGARETVLVVGAGPSGSDISADLAHTPRIVVRSVTEPPADGKDGGAENVTFHPRVAEYAAGGVVRFVDGTSTRVDRAILATGYDFSFPFLRPPILLSGLPPVPRPHSQPNALPAALYASPYHVFPLARHIFPLSDGCAPGSLAFLGLPVRVAPFPLFEAQARAIVQVFLSPSALDHTAESAAVLARCARIRAALPASLGLAPDQADGEAETERAVAQAYHRFAEEGEQFAYRDALNAFAAPGVPSGRERQVQPWVIEAYGAKGAMRAQWRLLEREGVAEHWVRGVGEGGADEWIELMRRVVRKAQDGEGVVLASRTAAEGDHPV